MITPTLIKAVFVNPHDGMERRGFRSHLKDSTNKPVCGCRDRSFGIADGVAARWVEVQGELTCPVCIRIADRMNGGDAA